MDTNCKMMRRGLVVLAVASHLPSPATGFHLAPSRATGPSTAVAHRCFTRRRQRTTSPETTIGVGAAAIIPNAAAAFAADHRRRRTSSSPLDPLGMAADAAATLLVDAASAIDNFYVTSPYAAAAITCGAKASAADYVAQRRHIKTRAAEEQAEAEEEALAAAAAAAASSEASLEEEVTTTTAQPRPLVVFADEEVFSAAVEERKDGGTTATATAQPRPLVVFADEEEEMAAEVPISVEEEPYQTARTAAFLLYGALYQGMAQEYIYNHLYPEWFGDGTSVSVVLSKVAFDLLVQTTLVTLPVAYLVKSAIFRYSPLEGMRRYWEDIRLHGLLVKYFTLWGPVQCLTFGVVPEHLRVSFIALVSFFWLIILSTISAKPREADLVDEDGDDLEECSLVDGSTCNIDG